MEVANNSIGKFHHFDLARQLERRGCLKAIFTGYPKQKLTREELPPGKVHTFPWFHAPYMLMARFISGSSFHREMAWWATQTFDRHVAASPVLKGCDVFIGLSGAALRSGQRVQAQGGKYVCDRGSSHIRYQDNILREEYVRWGLPFAGVDPRVIRREEQEYASADVITVPSGFVRQSFKELGVPDEKMVTIPYGVDLSRFHPVADPSPDTFEVLFVGGVTLRKGIPDLLTAFAKLKHGKKRLRIVGSMPPETGPLLKRLPTENVEFLGHRPQPELKEIMSRSHVFVLPSIEEGLALVQAQAMACGCAVLATKNTGAADLFTDGVEGFIVEPRSAETLAERLSLLAEDPALLQRMRTAALQTVRGFGGWDRYGDQFVELCQRLSLKSV